MLKYLFWGIIISGTSGLYGQSPEIDLPIFGSGPFLTTDQSTWALFRNMAGMSALHNPELALGYQLPFGQPELQSLAFGLIIPLNPTLGISYYRTGMKEFLNQQVALSTSASYHGIDIGLRVRYWNVSISGIKALHAISLDAGILMQLTSQLSAGVLVSNLTHSKLGKDEILPIIWFTGLKYKISTELSARMELGQLLGSRWQCRLGIEYIIKEKLFTRTGFSLLGGKSYFGLGFDLTRLKVDYAIDLHPQLGITHQAGIRYGWL